MNAEYRTGFVALAGRSNVGKSTLLNRIVGEKVSIVTPKPQTTRRRTLGVLSDADAQLILIDAPGLHETRKLLNRRMVDCARRCIAEADVITVVIEAGRTLVAEDRRLLGELARLGRPMVVAINKIDLVTRSSLLPLAQSCAEAVPAAEIVPVSGLSGENVGELVVTLKRLVPAGPALMPEDYYTDQTERTLAEETIREKVFIATRQEVPFSTVVKLEEFIEMPERNLIRIVATIAVEREAHKGILIGAGAAQLKEIGQDARRELEARWSRRVYLDLRVKLDRDWTRDPRRLAEYGL